MKTAASILLLLAACLLPAAACAQALCNVPMFSPGESYTVVDDGNNLRQWGGDNYAAAPILGELNMGDEVRLIAIQGRWAEIVTVDGVHGFMSAQYIVPTRDFLAPGGPADRAGLLEPCYTPNSSYLTDLDGDGQNERLALTCEPGFYCAHNYLDVYDTDGTLLYQGPRQGDSRLIFCACNWGMYEPNVVMDLDNDGLAEMVAMHPQGDVSPGTFDMRRWNGAGFDPVWTDMGITADASDPEYFRVRPLPMDYALPHRYVFGMRRGPLGALEISVADDQWRMGTAEAVYDGRGFRVINWIEPLSAN